MEFKKEYNNKGEHIGYTSDGNFYSVEYILPEDAEIVEGEKPTQNEIDIANALLELSKTDSVISRALEDVYDVLSATAQNNIPQVTKEKILDKKSKRQAYLDLL